MKDFKDFIAGSGEINVFAYLIYMLYSCISFVPLSHMNCTPKVRQKNLTFGVFCYEINL